MPDKLETKLKEPDNKAEIKDIVKACERYILKGDFYKAIDLAETNGLKEYALLLREYEKHEPYPRITS